MPTSKDHTDHRRLLIVIAILVITRLAFILLMPAVYSKDLHAWLWVIDVLNNGGNPYKDTAVLNWPPFWMQVLFVVGKISAATTVSPIHLIQAVLISAEIVTVAISYKLTRKFFRSPVPIGVYLAAFALSPISIFLSCQHCNFDVFAGVWILLFVYALMRYHRDKQIEYWLGACFFLGMGILTKTVPFILTPLLLAGIRQQASFTKALGAILLLAPVVIGISIIYTLAPQGVGSNVLGYRSMAGWHGITGILNVMGLFKAIDVFSATSPFLLLLLMAFAAYELRKADTLQPRQILTIALLLLVFLPTFGPGYSPPYILWFLPLLAVYYSIAVRSIRRLLITGYIVVVLTYIAEYTFFSSHGAFIKTFNTSESMAQLCGILEQSRNQSLIRLPMFVVYVVCYISLLRSYKTATQR